MKHIKSFAIFEGKQVGILYHYTSLNFLVNILETNSLFNRSRHSKAVCFTRNKYFHMDGGDGVQIQARLIIDGDKLSNNYRVYPCAETLGMRNTWKGLPSNQGIGRLEFEERVDADIKNLSKYIIGVEVADDLYYNLPQSFIDKIQSFGFELGYFEPAYSNINRENNFEG